MQIAYDTFGGEVGKKYDSKKPSGQRSCANAIGYGKAVFSHGICGGRMGKRHRRHHRKIGDFMKFAYPAIDAVFDAEDEKVNTLVIENPSLLYALLEDLGSQMEGMNGDAVVSENGTVLRTDKNAELLTQFFPFELNKKPLLNKIASELERTALHGEFYAESMELVAAIEAFLLKLSFDISCDVSYTKLDIGSIIKSAGIEINDDKTSLCERIVDYMELVTAFDRKKLFVTVNLRGFVPDKEMNLFLKTVKGHGFSLLMIENHEYPLLEMEKRTIVDSDLCLIC